MRSNAALKKAFNQYNKSLFQGKLSGDVKIFWKDMYCLGETWKYTDGTAEIFLNEGTRRWPKTWRLTLIHEMVHISLPAKVGHGPKFQKAMLKLTRDKEVLELL